MKRGVVAALLAWIVLFLSNDYILRQREVALCKAAGNADVGLVLRLLKEGVSPRAKPSILMDRYDYVYSGTALHFALVNYGRDEASNGRSQSMYRRDVGMILQLLIRAGANVDTVDNRGDAPIFFAHDPVLLKILLDNHANPNINCSYRGYPILIHAIYNQQWETVKLLIGAGVDVNKDDGDGNSPLKIAKMYATGEPEGTGTKIVHALRVAGATMEGHDGSPTLRTE